MAAFRKARNRLRTEARLCGLSCLTDEEEAAMDIALDKVCDIIVRARAIDVRDGDAETISGSNPTDDANALTLVESPDDATEEELREVIAGLNEDERHDLIALVYIGRGDMEPEEWVEAVRLAREREDASSVSAADWLLGIPNLGDLLDEGLAALGRSCA
jgi:hypothetical protein